MDETEKRLLECEPKATKGPVDVRRFDCESGEIRYQLQGDETPYRVLGYFDDHDGNRRAKYDAEFYAAARVAVPTMLRELDRLRAIEAAAKELIASHDADMTERTVESLARNARAGDALRSALAGKSGEGER
jgi:hypothetical protein